MQPVFKQVYAACGTFSLMIVYGFITGLQSIIIPKLRSDKTIVLDINQESWIVSVQLMVLFPVQLLTGSLMFRFGRKLIMFISILPLGLTCILLNLASNYTSLLIAFIMLGFGAGGTGGGAMMIAETTSPKYRGVLLIAKIAMAPVGITLAHFLGNFVHWKILALCGIVPTIFGLITIATSPDSPIWLAAQKRYDDCRKAFIWLRGDEENEELQDLIKTAVNQATNVHFKDNIRKSKIKRKIKYLLDKTFLKAMAISIICTIFVCSCGKTFFMVFAIDNITKILGDKKYAFYGAFIIDIIDCSTLLLSCFFSKKIKSRKVRFTTGFFAISVLLLFCLTSYLFAHNIIPINYRWITLIIIAIYFSILNIGVLPFFSMILNEIVPISHREIGMTVTSISYISMQFTVLKISPYLLKYYELHGAYLIYSILITVSLIYLYYTVPDTNNKTLLEIETEFKDANDTKILKEKFEENENMLQK